VSAELLRDGDVEFARGETRRTSVKRWCDCGCVIDGGEPYVYEVWKVAGDEEIHDLETCEPCAVDYSGSGGWYRAS
jgi:hypothetical protein